MCKQQYEANECKKIWLTNWRERRLVHSFTLMIDLGEKFGKLLNNLKMKKNVFFVIKINQHLFI